MLINNTGVPKENFDGEKRVAVTPAVVRTLLKSGFKEIRVEKRAGEASEFTVNAESYKQLAGCTACQLQLYVTLCAAISPTNRQ